MADSLALTETCPDTKFKLISSSSTVIELPVFKEKKKNNMDKMGENVFTCNLDIAQ